MSTSKLFLEKGSWNISFSPEKCYILIVFKCYNIVYLLCLVLQVAEAYCSFPCRCYCLQYYFFNMESNIYNVENMTILHCKKQNKGDLLLPFLERILVVLYVLTDKLLYFLVYCLYYLWTYTPSTPHQFSNTFVSM